jgi:hypothetical protein
MTRLDGWWFAKRDADGEVRLPNGDGRIVHVGETLTIPGPPILCHYGLHASIRAWNALQYAPGSILCRVRLSGQIVEGSDKACATERTPLAMVDADRTLRIFALGVALAALRAERADGREPDPRSWAAITTTIAWMEGRADDAARIAAMNVAWDAAWSAARSAARSAAESAAQGAAWGAARNAAWSAARSAAESAARNAAWGAAESAALAVADRIFEDVCLEAIR